MISSALVAWEVAMSVAHELDQITQRNWTNFKRLMTWSVIGVAGALALLALFLL
jgi:hypothetical protein